MTVERCTAKLAVEPMSFIDSEALVRRVVDAIWNGRDLDAADELFAPEYVNHDGVIPDLVRGPEAIKISVAFYRLAYPNLHVRVDELDARAETVVFRWTALSAPPGTVATDALVASLILMAGITRVRVANGMIVESWTEWDWWSRLRELGELPE